MNSGKYVFSQLLQFINRYEFEKCVAKYDGDYRTRGLNCWNQFVQLFFGQLTSRNSLRDICTCLKAHHNKLYHLGIKQYVNQSTLSRANENRDWRIFADFGDYLIQLVKPLYENQPIPKVDLDNDVFALDSTTISLSIKLFTWAQGKYSRGAAKIHTALDIRAKTYNFKRYTTNACKKCPVKQECSKAKYGKGVQRSEYQEYINQNKERIENNKEYYRKRQAIVEHPYGTIKRQWGFSYILTKKGKQRASSDVGFMFIAYNFRRIMNIVGKNALRKYLEVLVLSILRIFRTLWLKISFFKAINLLRKNPSSFFERFLNRLIFKYYLIRTGGF